MKQQQIQQIMKAHINFEIVTSDYHSPRLNENKVEFLKEGLIKIEHSELTTIYIEAKNIKYIIGVGKV